MIYICIVKLSSLQSKQLTMSEFSEFGGPASPRGPSLKRVGSRQRVSMIESEANPFLAGDVDHSSVKVENLSDAKPISKIDLDNLVSLLATIEYVFLPHVLIASKLCLSIAFSETMQVCYECWSTKRSPICSRLLNCWSC